MTRNELYDKYNGELYDRSEFFEDLDRVVERECANIFINALEDAIFQKEPEPLLPKAEGEVMVEDNWDEVYGLKMRGQ